MMPHDEQWFIPQALILRSDQTRLGEHSMVMDPRTHVNRSTTEQQRKDGSLSFHIRDCLRTVLFFDLPHRIASHRKKLLVRKTLIVATSFLSPAPISYTVLDNANLRNCLAF